MDANMNINRIKKKNWSNGHVNIFFCQHTLLQFVTTMRKSMMH